MAPYRTLFEQKFASLSKKYGGWVNSHAHPDRAFIIDKKYFTGTVSPRLSLRQKQSLISIVHQNKHFQRSLVSRLNKLAGILHRLGTRKLYGFVDADPSCGLRDIQAALAVKKRWKGRLNFQIGAYCVAGLGDDEDERYLLFEKAARMGDFLGGLPEKDDQPGAWGSIRHMKALLRLGIKLHKEVHIHVDQKNHPAERMTEMLVQAVKETGSPQVRGARGPTVWVVHSISPSCYPKARLARLIRNLKKHNIGVVCCPNAVSMLQPRQASAPVHNCTPPVLELLAGGARVRIGSDNIEDYMVPSGTPDLAQDVVSLTNLLRYYDIDLYARLCCDRPITKKQQAEIRAYLLKCEKNLRNMESDIKYQNKKNGF